MKIAYIDKVFRTKSRVMIAKANQVIEEWQAKGYDLTLRQLYYQFVAHDLFTDDRKFRWTGSNWVKDPNGTKNADPNYDMLGELINDARLAGLIDWDAIVDRTRNLKAMAHWNQPSEIISSSAAQFRYDLWKDQPTRVEVWVEKDALVDVIGRAANKFDVPFFSCRGYTSQSEMWGAGQRMGQYIADGATSVVILHLGDHDPSGVDMTRDIDDRLTMFTHGDGTTAPIIKRIALTMAQIKKYNPPPNPAKLTDCRAQGYIKEFGNESWELDALEPDVIAKLVETNIKNLMDEDLYNAAKARQDAAREQLKKLSTNFDKAMKFLSGKQPVFIGLDLAHQGPTPQPVEELVRRGGWQGQRKD